MRNRNRQLRRSRLSGGNVNQALANQQQRYFNNAAGSGNPRRIRPRKMANLAVGLSLKGTAATKRALAKLAKKRVQRAKLLVTKKKPLGGKLKKMVCTGIITSVA